MAEEARAPIERHEAIVPFSRDHYVGLVQAQHLMKAAEAGDVERRKAVAAFIDAWDGEIAKHFDDEERLLLELLQEQDRRRLVGEHEALRVLANQARKMRRQVDPRAADVKQIGILLEQHIRWEERELFARLQEQLTDAQLSRLAVKTAEVEQSRPRSACRRDGGR